MIECKRILAVVDAERDKQPALSRAYEFASKTGATVTAMMVVYDLSYDMTTMLSPDERESMRDAVTKEHAKWLSAQLKEQGFSETDMWLSGTTVLMSRLFITPLITKST